MEVENPFQKVHDCKGKLEVPCLCHCSPEILNGRTESGMSKIFENTLNITCTKIARSIAFKAWDEFGGTNFKACILNARDELYKKTFAKFYHDDSFIEIYKEAYKNSQDSEIIPRGLLFYNILAASKRGVMKKFLDFLNVGLQTEFPITNNHIDIWSNWLREEKQNPKKPSKYGLNYIIWPFSAIEKL